MSDRFSAMVPADYDGIRADRVLAGLGEMSRSRARELIDGGSVTVNGAAVGRSSLLRTGDVLEYPQPTMDEGLMAEDVAFEVLADYGDVLVVDKPAGVVVHPGAGNERGTLVAGLVNRFPELEGLGEERRWGLVHRLDRDTSGALLVARTEEMHRFLQAELKARRVKRIYFAVVTGRLEAATGTIDAPVGRDPFRPTRMAVIADGRAARTHYRRIAEWPDLTLVEVRLETGRTHQIRVHFSSIDHSVLGDPVYGSTATSEVDPGRIWLHASRIQFPRSDGALAETVAPLPPDLRRSLDRLGEPLSGVVNI